MYRGYRVYSVYSVLIVCIRRRVCILSIVCTVYTKVTHTFITRQNQYRP